MNGANSDIAVFNPEDGYSVHCSETSIQLGPGHYRTRKVDKALLCFGVFGVHITTLNPQCVYSRAQLRGGVMPKFSRKHSFFFQKTPMGGGGLPGGLTQGSEFCWLIRLLFVYSVK